MTLPTIEGRAITRAGALVTLLSALVLVLLAAMNPQSASVHGDGYYTYLWARSIVFDHDVDFGNDYQTCTDPWGMASMPHGLAMNQWSPGAALFFVPILAFDVLTQNEALDDPNPINANGCLGPLAERAVRGSVVAGLLLLWLAFLSARRVSSDGVAALASAAAVLGGPIVYYVVILLSYGHAASGALGGLAVWAWLRERERFTAAPRGEPPPVRGRAWVGMGIALGLAMLARPQNAVLVVLPLSLFLERARDAIRPSSAPERAASASSRWRRLAPLVGWGFAFTAAVFLVFGLQLYQWWSSTGELFLVPQGDYYLRFESPRVMNLLFSSANGLFTYAPLTYLAVAGLVLLAWRPRTRGIGVPLLVVLALTTWLNACVADWWGAVGFAARRFDAMTVPFAIGTAALFAELLALVRARPRLAPALGLSAVVASGVIATSSSAMMVAVGYRSDVAQPSTELWARDSSAIQRGIWDAVGNPLAWPASIPFALLHGVHPRLWDQASMPELFFHRWLTLEAQPDLTTLDLVGAHGALAVGFNAEQGGYRFPRGRDARVLVPISYPYVGALALAVSARPERGRAVSVELALDDEALGTFSVPEGPTELRVPVREPHQGIVELRISLHDGTLGLARIELLDRDPAPSVAQARRNALLRERRIAWRIARGLTPEGTR